MVLIFIFVSLITNENFFVNLLASFLWNAYSSVLIILKPDTNGYTADLWNIVDSVPNHCNKGTIIIKWITQIFWFSSAYESYVYILVY